MVEHRLTDREVAYMAMCSQIRADGRRQEAWEERQEFLRGIRCDLKAAGVVFGILGVIAACWAVAWGLVFLVSA